MRKLRLHPEPLWGFECPGVLVCGEVRSFDFFHHPLEEQNWRARCDVLNQIIFQRTADSLQAQSRLLSTL
ncbi:hypothetical protein C6P91_13630 [Burkholderia multivorans]|nr:hypothetical protein C6P91_13630 [Burkholderia multivorans]